MSCQHLKNLEVSCRSLDFRLLRDQDTNSIGHWFLEGIVGCNWGEATSFSDWIFMLFSLLSSYPLLPPSWPMTALQYALKNLCWSEMFPWSINWYKFFGRQFGNVRFFLNVHILFDSTILRIYFMDNLVHVHKDICTSMFPEALFVIERNWK